MWNITYLPIGQPRIELCFVVMRLLLLEHDEMLDRFFPLRLVEVKSAQLESGFRVNGAAVVLAVKLQRILEIDRAGRFALAGHRAFHIRLECLRWNLRRFLDQIVARE